jgi:hypothetical protein
VNDLDIRARAATEAVHGAVAEYTPAVGLAAVAAQRQRVRRTGTALAGGFAVVVLLLGAWLRGPVPESDVADFSTTSPAIEELAPIVDEAAPTIPQPDLVETPGPDQVAPDPAPLAAPAEPAVPETANPPATSGTPAPEPPEPEPPVVEEPAKPVDTEPPPLVVVSPTDGAKLTEKVATFKGTTEPGARVLAGRYEANVAGDGRWSIRLVLKEGRNGARFTAIDAAGNETTVRITVIYEEPIKDDPPPKIEFTASATYGSCAFDPPYDVYFGTAQPESKVTISSPYGGATTKADAEGRWEKKVFFSDAPVGETFLVTVRDESGSKKKFEFTALPAD